MSGVAPPARPAARSVRIDLITEGAVQYRFRDLAGVAERGTGVLLPCWQSVQFSTASGVDFVRITLCADQLPDALTDGDIDAFGPIRSSRLSEGLLALSEQTLLDEREPAAAAALVLKELTLAIVSEATSAAIDLRT